MVLNISPVPRDGGDRVSAEAYETGDAAAGSVGARTRKPAADGSDENLPIASQKVIDDSLDAVVDFNGVAYSSSMNLARADIDG